MKKFLNIMKEKFNNLKEIIKDKKFNFKKLLLLFTVAVITNLFSRFLGGILFCVCGLYVVIKGIVPVAQKLGTKLINFVKKQYNKIKEKKKTKNGKKFTLFKSKKKKVQKEEVKEEKKEKKKIPNIIKNFKVHSCDKFKFNLKVKRDTNGCKIVNGSYRIKGNKIIDNKIYLDTLEPVIENETEYSKQKTYVKTK